MMRWFDKCQLFMFMNSYQCEGNTKLSIFSTAACNDLVGCILFGYFIHNQPIGTVQICFCVYARHITVVRDVLNKFGK